MLEDIKKISAGLDKKFPEGREPFKIIARLAEECGELASEVNHFENTGVKNKKHGAPSKENLAKEIQDVIRSALQLCSYYNVENELKESIKKSLAKLKRNNLLK